MQHWYYRHVRARVIIRQSFLGSASRTKPSIIIPAQFGLLRVADDAVNCRLFLRNSGCLVRDRRFVSTIFSFSGLDWIILSCCILSCQPLIAVWSAKLPCFCVWCSRTAIREKLWSMFYNSTSNPPYPPETHIHRTATHESQTGL